MKPWIGITADFEPGAAPKSCVGADYYNSIAMAGGVPVLLPVIWEPEWLERLDGLVFSGGMDIDSVHFGQQPHPTVVYAPERDAMEMTLYKAARAKGLPMLGICRGIQLINVAAGGTLWQDIPSQVPAAHMHSQRAARDYVTHEVTLAGRLAEWLGVKPRVNSFHHQAVKDVAKGFHAAGWAGDGIIEAVEADDGWVMGIQWHCENLQTTQPAMRHIFEELVKACR